MYNIQQKKWLNAPELKIVNHAVKFFTYGDNLYSFCGRDTQYNSLSSIEILNAKKFLNGEQVSWQLLLMAIDEISF